MHMCRLQRVITKVASMGHQIFNHRISIRQGAHTALRFAVALQGPDRPGKRSRDNASGQGAFLDLKCHAHVQAAKDDSDNDLSDDDSDDDTDGAPVMHLRQISQPCGINRVRSMPQQSSIIATWGEDARVQVCMHRQVPMSLV